MNPFYRYHDELKKCVQKKYEINKALNNTGFLKIIPSTQEFIIKISSLLKDEHQKFLVLQTALT